MSIKTPKDEYEKALEFTKKALKLYPAEHYLFYLKADIKRLQNKPTPQAEIKNSVIDKNYPDLVKETKSILEQQQPPQPPQPR